MVRVSESLIPFAAAHNSPGDAVEVRAYRMRTLCFGSQVSSGALK
jgi:hypothetical protein